MLMTWHTRFSFFKSARDMENEHLRAQIDDAAALVDIIQDWPGEGKRPTEPAFYMWAHHLDALLIMGMAFSMEWTYHRGFEDKVFWKFSRLADSRREAGVFNYRHPPWFRDADVCRSHRSVLMARHSAIYDEDLWPGTPKRLPLLWPVTKEGGAVYELRVAKADLPLVRQKKLSIPSSIKSRVVNL